MLEVWKKWYMQFFGSEEALLLLVMIAFSLVVIITMGDVLAPVLAAMVFAFLLEGVNSRLAGWGVPRTLAVWASFLLFVGGFAIVLLGLVPILWGQLERLYAELPRMVELVRESLLAFQQTHSDFLSDARLSRWADELTAEIGRMGQRVVPFFIGWIPGLVGLLIYTVLVPILIFFFLKDKDQIFAWLARFLPAERPLMRHIWKEMNDQVANYVRGKAIEIVAVGAVSYIVFVIFGLNYAVLLGFLVGLSVVIPYVGAALVTIPVVLVAFFQWDWSADFLWLLFAYLVIQALDGYILVPVLFSEVVHLHPVAIIVAVLVFGSFWGMWGVFFAIPLAAFVMALINAWPRHDAAVTQES
jgi:putative permease